MTNSPNWAADFDDAELIQHFGAATTARGRQVATLGRVGEVNCAGTVATAQVRGSGYVSYHTTVAIVSGRLRTSCSCPMRQDCKHAVALLLRLKHPPGTTQGWRQLLGNFRDSPQRTAGRELGLLLSEDGAELTLRPLQRGVRGNWIRSGATWDELKRTSWTASHQQVLQQLLESRSRSTQPSHRSAVLRFDEFLPSVWDALAAAVAAGVELVAGTTA